MKKSKLLIISLLIINCQLSIINCSAQYTTILNFAGIPNGASPYGSLISDGTFLYGITSLGGTSNAGTIFKIKPDGTAYSKLSDIPSYTEGDLFNDGTFMYGLLPNGGSQGEGTIFKIKTDGTGYSIIYDFSTPGSGGHKPEGSLISDGTFLYGMTSLNNGNIFKINKDGTGYSVLHNFGSSNGPDGSNPWGSLVFDGTFLYGMTTTGGAYICSNGGCGTIFKIKPDGTAYSILYNFDNGRNPTNGYLISIGNFLFGMTNSGGSSQQGTIFKIKNDGTSFAKLLDFTGLMGNGGLPSGSLTYDGTYLYGMGTSGGSLGCNVGCGSIVQVKPDGTGYAKLYDFSGIGDGSSPYGSLFFNGNSLYGMTLLGGTNSHGTIFKFHSAGMGITENNSETDFKIYPNPSNGTFTIDTKENDYKLFITDILGAIVYQSEIKNVKSEIDLSKQPNGIYFINIKTEKGTSVQKLIIQK